MQLKPTSAGKSHNSNLDLPECHATQTYIWRKVRLSERILARPRRRSNTSQPQPPKSPAPPPLDPTQWERSIDSHKVNTLTSYEVGLIVFGETQSYTDSDKANDTIGGAREKVAHTVINGDSRFGHKRPITALAIEPTAKAMKDQRTRAAYDSSLSAARDAYLNPMDPTHGATHLNMRPTADRSNFKAGNPNATGFSIKTQSGPFNNSFPTRGKGGLPAQGVYIDTYGDD